MFDAECTNYSIVGLAGHCGWNGWAHGAFCELPGCWIIRSCAILMCINRILVDDGNRMNIFLYPSGGNSAVAGCIKQKITMLLLAYMPCHCIYLYIYMQNCMKYSAAQLRANKHIYTAHRQMDFIVRSLNNRHMQKQQQALNTEKKIRGCIPCACTLAHGSLQTVQETKYGSSKWHNSCMLR